MREWKFNHIDFSVYPYYDGNDLGVFLVSRKNKSENLSTNSKKN